MKRDDDRTLLADTRARVARWPGFTVTRSYRDGVGAYAFQATHDDRTYICVVKRDLHAGLASFMRRVVERAVGEGYVLVEFVTEGEASTGPSAKGVETSWIELDCAEFGVTLGRYAFGDADLVPPGGEEEGQARLEVGR